jgi:putative tryptophan/tyrosine transport system substrate-binding protein
VVLNIVAGRAWTQIERAVIDFGRAPDGALMILPNPLNGAHREQIAQLAIAHRLPAIYAFRNYVDVGGLLSYGPDPIDLFRRAAVYVDRILRGEKPAELPVQAPVKYELIINAKTAKSLGLDIPPTLLARADEVIE